MIDPDVRIAFPKSKARLRREAANWLARLEGDPDPAIERSFQRWYDANPAHAAAFDRIKQSYAQAGLLRYSTFSRERPPAKTSPGRGQPRYAMAAAIALIVLAPLGLLLVRQDGLSPFAQNSVLLVATKVGEVQRVTLADHSSLIVDADSAVAIELRSSERRATLRRGRTRIVVAADSRPFTINAGAVRVTTRQATVDAELVGGAGRLEMLSGGGRIELEPGHDEQAAQMLREGHGLAVRAGEVERYRLGTGRADWTQGMLQFDASSLSDAAALANRYSEQKIMLSEGIGSLQVTGAFKAGDVDGLARSLAAAFDLNLVRTRDGHFLLSMKRDGASKKKNGG